jgi:hypothetical protein
VRVLELGDETRFGLEAAHEGRLVDELGSDDLDRHFAPDRGLVGAEDDAEVAPADLFAQLVASNGAAERDSRQRRRQPVDPKQREVRGEPVEEELEDVYGAADALEPILPERLGLPARLTCCERSVRVGGEEHLPAMARGEDSPGPVEHGAEVVAVAALDLSHVDRHPHEQRSGLGQVDGRQLALDLLGGRDGCADVGEDRVDPVADAFDDASSRALEGRPHDPVVPLDGGPHVLGLQLPEHGRVLDVGEQER